MRTLAQRKLLESICANSPWTYAVFWKLNHQNMLLTWEDGYCDYTKPRKSLKARLDHRSFNEEDQSLTCNQQSSRNPMEFSLGFAIGYMSCLQYAFGEGVIGKIAFSGDESWVFLDINYSESKFPDEWLQQVMAGIKTILLVPVLPNGVLQLGSIDKVAENHLWVTGIRQRFDSFHPKKEPMPPVSSDSIVCQPCTKGSFIFNGGCVASSSWNSPSNRSESENFELMVTAITHEELPSSNNLPFMVPDVTTAFRRGPSDVTELPCEYFILDPCPSPVQESNLQFLCEARVGDLCGSTCVEEVTKCSFFCDDGNKEHSALGEIVDCYISGDTPEGPGTEKDGVFTDHTTEASFDFPVGSELHEALGAAIQTHNGEIPWKSYELGEYDTDVHSYLGSDMDFLSTYYQSSKEAFGFVSVDDNISHPQAILPGAFESLDDFQFYNFYGIKPNVLSPFMLSVSSLRGSQSEVKPGWPLEPGSFFSTVDISQDSTYSDCTNRSALTALVEEVNPKKHSLKNSGKGDKQSSNKKRKVAENAGYKQRPRDRQLIQDRVKELRELIPNGSTYSIDGLLHKAIKHIMFLSSVTEQAEKLTQTVNQEVPWKKKSADIQNRLKRESWAIEKSKDYGLFPIVVEDLKVPGCLLIEMLLRCNELDLLFEISKVMCHLRLTILKGMMETYSDDTLAQFIIQAPRGFSRMEIFVPLMQLLQSHRKRVHEAT